MRTAELAIVAELKKAPELCQGGGVALSLLIDGLGKQDGKPVPCWCRTTCFGEAAETAARLRVGDVVLARGKPTLDRWKDRATGLEKAGLSLLADEVMDWGTRLRATASEIKLQMEAEKSPPKKKPKRAKPKADLEGGLPKGPKSYSAIRVKQEPQPHTWQRPVGDWYEHGGDQLDDAFSR